MFCSFNLSFISTCCDLFVWAKKGFRRTIIKIVRFSSFIYMVRAGHNYWGVNIIISYLLKKTKFWVLQDIFIILNLVRIRDQKDDICLHMCECICVLGMFGGHRTVDALCTAERNDATCLGHIHKFLPRNINIYFYLFFTFSITISTFFM